MPTHAAVAGFDRAADVYERGRPGYPLAAIEHLVGELEIGPGSRVVELGAGTGKFTRSVVETGAPVIAVEPTRAMRSLLRRNVPGASAVSATAERLPFRAGSITTVLAAQAFHWFALPAAAEEIARVVRPGGGVGLLWNTRDESVPWAARLGALISAHTHGVPRYRSGRWKRAFEGRPEFSELEHRRFAHHQRGTVDTLVDRVLSISVIALLPPAERESLAVEVRTLLATDPATAGRRELELPYQTDVYVARRLGGRA